jgi:hypothetical protein
VVVLLNPNPYRNKTYNQTGPGPTRDEQVVKLLTKHYGTPIEYKYKDSIIERGLPE